MFRSIIEQKNKHLFIFHYKSDNRQNYNFLDTTSRSYDLILLLIFEFLVDQNRQANGNIWFENILSEQISQ